MSINVVPEIVKTYTYTKLTSPSAVKKAIQIWDEIGESAFLALYGFQNAREYVLRYEGKEYPSKAIAAVAYGIQHPEEPQMTSLNSSGGKSPGKAGWALARIGFEVDGIPKKARHWSLSEVELTVRAYLNMLGLELAGIDYVKAEFNRNVKRHLNSRSTAAIEYKFQNISAALQEMKLPFIDGYKPYSEYQALLKYVLEDELESSFSVLGNVADQVPVNGELDSYFVEPPETKLQLPEGKQKVIQTSWSKREAKNRKLGLRGEVFVLELEKRRLINLGLAEKSEQIEHVSQTIGDGLGYDILSFDEDGRELHIEVKTTLAGIEHPFWVTRNELSVSQDLSESYRLYRVFNFGTNTQVYCLEGALDEVCQLLPANFLAAPA